MSNIFCFVSALSYLMMSIPDELPTATHQGWLVGHSSIWVCGDGLFNCEGGEVWRGTWLSERPIQWYSNQKWPNAEIWQALYWEVHIEFRFISQSFNHKFRGTWLDFLNKGTGVLIITGSAELGWPWKWPRRQGGGSTWWFDEMTESNRAFWTLSLPTFRTIHQCHTMTLSVLESITLSLYFREPCSLSLSELQKERWEQIQILMRTRTKCAPTQY